MTVGGRVGALWIGGLEPCMDEAFLQNAMNMMGANFCTPHVLGIKTNFSELGIL